MVQFRVCLGLTHICMVPMSAIALVWLGSILGTRSMRGIHAHSSLVNDREKALSLSRKIRHLISSFRESLFILNIVLLAGMSSMVVHHTYQASFDPGDSSIAWLQLTCRLAYDLRLAALVFVCAIVAVKVSKSVLDRIASRLDTKITSYMDLRKAAVDEFLCYIGADLSTSVSRRLMETGHAELITLREEIKKLREIKKSLEDTAVQLRSQNDAYKLYKDKLGDFVWCGDCTRTLGTNGEDHNLRTPKSEVLPIISLNNKPPIKISKRTTKSDSKNPDNKQHQFSEILLTDRSHEESVIKNTLREPLQLQIRTLGDLPSGRNIRLPVVCRKNCVARYLHQYSKLNEDLNSKLAGTRSYYPLVQKSILQFFRKNVTPRFT